MRDYFSEEILGQKPKRDYFAEEILGKKEQERDYFAEEVEGALPKEEEPKWWQKELTTLKEFAKFPYTVTKEFTYPTAKGLVTFPFRPKEAEAEVREAGEMGVEMGKGLGRGMLDWLGLAFPDPVIRQRAMERIGERIKEHGYLAEAIHPLIGLGLGKGVLGRAGKVTIPKRAVIKERLKGIEEMGRPTIKERLKGIEELEIPPAEKPFLPKMVEEIITEKPKLPPKKKIPGAEEMELPKIKANVEIDSFVDYFESIQAPKEFRPPRKPARTAIGERLREEGLRGKELTLETNVEFIRAVHDYGIALRQTKGGRVQPTIREAGTYVPEDFATYTEFKDAKTGVFGGTKDATRFIQEIDGALSVEAKAKLPGQAGPVEQYVLHRTRDMVKFKLNWTNAMKSRLATITKNSSKKQLQIANQVIEHISREGAYVDPAKLVTNPKISALTTDVNVIRLAQEGRKLYESLLRHQNELRRLRGQKEIPHRDYYTAHSIHETTIWERALGHNKTPEQIIGPGLPDYIKPNAPFNPRAMARELGLPETAREMNLKVLLERYIETAAKDIYNTSIVQNNKAFIQQLKSMGYEHAARGLENWTAEAFTGVRAAVDRVANLSPTIHKGMNRFRRGLLRSVFPLNFAWNTFVQTSSGVLTVTRYGLRNSVRGLYDWFGNKKIRQEIRDNAYSAIIKSQRSGRISRQDINRGIGAAERLSRGKLEKASDAANFFTEWVERHLTGWSVATAKHHGASVGLKGKALWEYASDGGAKTQSMYNLEDLPGMLRSEVVKTTAPFQTFSFEIYNTLKEFAGKTGTPPATTAIRIKMVLRFLAGATAVNYIGQAAIGRKPWELSSFIPFYGTFLAPISAALRGKDVSMTTTRGLPSPVGIAIKGGQAVHKGLLRPGFAATKEFARTRDFRAALEEFIATGKWDKLRRFTIRYLSGFAGIPGGTQMNRIVDGLIATSAGGMVDSADRLMFPITDTKDKIRSFLAGPWSTKGGQEYWDKRGKELNLDIEFLEENPLLRDVVESFPVFGDFYKFRKDSESQTRQNIKRMLRTGNTKSAYRERFEWNMENPDKKISREWYNKQLREVKP